jgi:hypothetical protein
MEPFIFDLLRENANDFLDDVTAIAPGQKCPHVLADDATHTSFSWEYAVFCRLEQALRQRPG